MSKDKKKHYLMGGTSITDEQRKTNAQAHEGRTEEFKKHLEVQSDKKKDQAPVDIPTLIKTFPWRANEDRVVIFPDPVDMQLPSGLFIPDSVKEKPQMGTVICVGEAVAANVKILEHLIALRGEIDASYNDEEQEPVFTNKPGDRVLFGKYSGVEIVINEVPVLVMRAADIIATLKDEN